MKYKDYDIENFLMDEFFIQWVKNPNANNRHFWEKWLREHHHKRDMVMEAVEIIRSIHYADQIPISDKLYVDTFENIVKAEKELPGAGKTENRTSFWSAFFSLRKIAATIVIAFCCWMAYSVISPSLNKETEVTREVVMVKRNNPAGKKSIITLADGSKIYLNSESSIEYPSQFSDGIRQVKLTGEAFFEVQKDNRPFMVQSGETRIHVLGTTFNVQQRTKRAIKIALVSGKVQVNDLKGNQVQLEPSEMLVMEENGKLYKTGFDPLEITGWKDKYLVFKSNDLEEVKAKIEQWYGVRVQLKGNIPAKWSYSGTYRDETLENILKGIFLTSGMKYKIENKDVIITNPK